MSWLVMNTTARFMSELLTKTEDLDPDARSEAVKAMLSIEAVKEFIGRRINRNTVRAIFNSSCALYNLIWHWCEFGVYNVEVGFNDAGHFTLVDKRNSRVLDTLDFSLDGV